MTRRARGLLAGLASFFRRRSPPEAPIRRTPSPASVGLDDDPIVAALVGRPGEQGERGRTGAGSGRAEP